MGAYLGVGAYPGHYGNIFRVLAQFNNNKLCIQDSCHSYNHVCSQNSKTHRPSILFRHSSRMPILLAHGGVACYGSNIDGVAGQGMEE